MSLSEDVQTLLRISQMTNPQHGVQQAIDFVNEIVEKACRAAGQGSADAAELFDVGQAALDQLRAGLAATQLFFDTCGIVAARHM